MIVFYDGEGKIITKDAKKEDIKGSINVLELEVLQNKVLDRVDVTKLPNVPIYRDLPKTEVQITQEQINMLIPQLLEMDKITCLAIKSMQSKIDALEFATNQKGAI